MKKKTMICIAAAMTAAFGITMTTMPVLADFRAMSRGNLVYEEEDVCLYASDFDSLYACADGLQKEQGIAKLPELSEECRKRREQIRSRGRIDYAGGAVILDSADFVRLADQIDGLDAAFTENTVKLAGALRQIGTYFTADGLVTHKQEEADASGEAAKLPLTRIEEGILQSQSVAFLKEQKIEPAAADNLSAGTAAWVDGRLCIGNGADNQAHYERGFEAGEAAGYQAGYAEGSKEGYDLGFEAGREQGRQDVIDDPGAWQIVTLPAVSSGRSEASFTAARTGTITLSASFYATSTGSHNANSFSIDVCKNNEIVSRQNMSDQGYGADTFGDGGSYQLGHSVKIDVNAGDSIVVRGITDGKVEPVMILAYYY